MEKQMMMNLNQTMPNITRNDLKEVYGLSEDEIVTLDQQAQNILGKTLIMVDSALRDDSLNDQQKIETGLNFIQMGMELIEHNFEELVESKVPKDQLN